MRATFAALEPHLSGGAYSNFMGDDDARAATVAYGATLSASNRSRRYTTPTTCSA